MRHQETTRLFARINKVAEVIPNLDAFAFFNNLTEAFRETQEVRRDIAKIEAMRDTIVTEITRRYNLYENVFDHIFDERKDVMRVYFDIIDRGVAQNDKGLIVQGLHGLSTFVASSPFANLKELSQLLESGKIEI